MLSTLPVSNQADAGNGLVLTDWHEYIAFVLGVYGTVVALTTLVVLQAGGLEEETEPTAVTVVE